MLWLVKKIVTWKRDIDVTGTEYDLIINTENYTLIASTMTASSRTTSIASLAAVNI